MSSDPSKHKRLRDLLKQPSRIIGKISNSRTSVSASSTPPNFPHDASNAVRAQETGASTTGNLAVTTGQGGFNEASSSSTPPHPGVYAAFEADNHKTELSWLRDSFEVLGKAADAVPPLKSLIDMFTASIDILQDTRKSTQEYEGLAINISKSIQALEVHLQRTNSPSMRQSVTEVLHELKEQTDYINTKLQRTGPKKYSDAEQDAEDIIQVYRRLEVLIQRLNSDAILNTWRTTYEIREAMDKQDVNTQLEGMNPVKEARYDSGAAEIRRSGCTPNTRVSILEDLVNWSQDKYGPRIYWMNGMAGTGKTTIAYSFCLRLKEMGQLGASFFCSRLLPGCRDANRIVPTLAYQCASVYAPFQNEVMKALDDDRDICSTGIESQFESLLSKAMHNVGETMRNRCFVLVLDALDECSDRASAQIIVNTLLRFGSELPVKLFVTSRPEPGLLDRALSGAQNVRSIFHLHDIEESLVQADIETYLVAELGSISTSEPQIKLLVERSGKLFIYAATAVRYILPSTVSVNSYKRLNTVLGTISTGSKRLYEPLDALYATILSAVLDNPALESEEAENIKMLLDTILCAQEPLSVKTLTQLLDLDSEEDARTAVESLRSVLHISDTTDLVSTLHASFPDFMMTCERSGHYYCDTELHHGFLASRCFITMKAMLRFNICSLESSFVLDKQVSWLPDEIQKRIPLHLFYSCKYWSTHLIQCKALAKVEKELDDFFYNRLLFWLEVLNLKGCIALASPMLSKTYLVMQDAKAIGFTSEICRDAQIFATALGTNLVRDSTPHIYISVLALWDKDRAIWKQYGQHTHGLIHAEGSAIRSRQAAELASWKLSSCPTSMAVASDGTRIAVGCQDGHVRVWHAHTGLLLLDLHHLSHDFLAIATSLAFSSDSNQLIALNVGADTRIYIWDAQTGQLLNDLRPTLSFGSPLFALSSDLNHIAVGQDGGIIYLCDTQSKPMDYRPLAQHGRNVDCLAYSPDGKQLASGLEDYTICVLDAHTGIRISGPLQGHETNIVVIAFSPDGKLLASSSKDCVALVWDLQTKLPAVNILKLTVLQFTSQLTFSPDNSRLACASDQNFSIHIWDIHSGTLLSQLTGHTDLICSVLYSPDGSRIYSASEDETIGIWDAYTKDTFQTPNSPYFPDMRALCFSSDGARIASGCEDGLIYIWSTHSGETLAGPFQGQMRNVLFLSFSLDGDQIFSYSRGGIYYIWDTQSGLPMTGPLQAPVGGSTNLLDFSPNFGSMVTGCENNLTICIWNILTGSLVAKSSRAHSAVIRTTSYSPDGRRIASGSQDGMIFIWEALGGQLVAGPISGHISSIESLKYSPDGNNLVSGSSDCSIRVWNAATGDSIAGPFIGHSHQIFTVRYSSDSRYILSSSEDRTIRIWDTKTGSMIIKPIKDYAPDNTGACFTATSPAGGLWASILSEDGAIRIWRFPTDRPTPSDWRHTWTLNEDGWLVTPDEHLLLWVPPDLRPGLIPPENITIIHYHGNWRVDFTGACVGEQWQNCYKMPQPVGN